MDKLTAKAWSFMEVDGAFSIHLLRKRREFKSFHHCNSLKKTIYGMVHTGATLARVAQHRPCNQRRVISNVPCGLRHSMNMNTNLTSAHMTYIIITYIHYNNIYR